MPRDPGALSALEQHVLLAVLRLHPNGYGVSISEEIENKTKKRTAIGSIYATLDRLHDRGFLTSREGEATQERGGKRKLHFEITISGRIALQASLSALDALRDAIIIGDAACAGL